LEFIRKNPGKRVVEIATALNIPFPNPSPFTENPACWPETGGKRSAGTPGMDLTDYMLGGKTE
jgi:hypothetical protein